jgi:hypothetical protein
MSGIGPKSRSRQAPPYWVLTRALQPTDNKLGAGALIPAVAAGVLHLGLHEFPRNVRHFSCQTREPLGYDGYEATIRSVTKTSTIFLIGNRSSRVGRKALPKSAGGRGGRERNMSTK